MEEILIDVSTLPAPEPFEIIMGALIKLDESQFLRVAHRKQPLLLYKPLIESGFDYHVQPGKTEALDIYIWHSSQNPPEGLIEPALASNTSR